MWSSRTSSTIPTGRCGTVVRKHRPLDCSRQRSGQRIGGRSGCFSDYRLPRQIANVRTEQKRGVWRFDWLLSMGTHVERLWSRHIRKYFEQAWRRELERWTADERWAMLWAEYAGEPVPKGFCGVGLRRPQNLPPLGVRTPSSAIHGTQRSRLWHATSPTSAATTSHNGSSQKPESPCEPYEHATGSTSAGS
jgi:hypothetical protein